MRTAKRLGSGDRISIKIRRMLRRSTAKNTPITAVERTRNSRGIRNEQAPPVSCARSQYDETRKNGKIVEGEKQLTHIKNVDRFGSNSTVGQRRSVSAPAPLGEMSRPLASFAEVPKADLKPVMAPRLMGC